MILSGSQGASGRAGSEQGGFAGPWLPHFELQYLKIASSWYKGVKSTKGRSAAPGDFEKVNSIY